MSTGIFSGSFDPFTLGHLWVVEQAAKIFDNLHVVVGPNPSKKSYFKTEDRILMIARSVKNKKIYVGPQVGNNVVEYAHSLTGCYRCGTLSEIKLIRGIRGKEDFEMESALADATRKLCPNLDTVFFYPPQHLRGISSSLVRKNMASGEIDGLVPKEVLDCMTELFYCKGWMVTTPEVASIFENGTAGFAPAPSETFTSSLGDDVPKKHWFMSQLLGNSKLDAMRTFFEKMAHENFIRFAGTVTAEQVRNMLDPFPYNVVVSEKYHLRPISIHSVQPTGDRYLSASQSLGPIIVDANEVLINTPYGKDLGPAIIIEGKHRWLDAKDRGESKIWAWVGEKALPFVERE